jgi:hypothetical protein
MAFDPEQIRRALAAQLEQQLREVNVYWYEPTAPVLPAVYIRPSPEAYIGYFATAGPSGIGDLALQIVVEVGGADSENVASNLNTFLRVGSGFVNSVPDAVMKDKTLGGVVQDCVVLRADVDDEIEGKGVLHAAVIARKQGANV